MAQNVENMIYNDFREIWGSECQTLITMPDHLKMSPNEAAYRIRTRRRLVHLVWRRSHSPRPPQDSVGSDMDGLGFDMSKLRNETAWLDWLGSQEKILLFFYARCCKIGAIWRRLFLAFRGFNLAERATAMQRWTMKAAIPFLISCRIAYEKVWFL